MPRHYNNATSIKDITRPIDLENENQGALLAEIANQFIVSTATYTLSRYEEQYGLDISPDISTEERRGRIKAIMRSFGIVNRYMLENLLRTIPFGDATIVENYANRSFKIIFNNYYSIPFNIPYILKIIDMIKPAHLSYTYTFAYNWWGKTDDADIVWDDGDTWDDLRTYKEV